MPVSAVPRIERYVPRVRAALREALDGRAELGFPPIEEPDVRLDVFPTDPNALAVATADPPEIRLAYLYLLDQKRHPETKEAIRTVHKASLIAAQFTEPTAQRQRFTGQILFNTTTFMNELERTIAGTDVERRYVETLAQDGFTPEEVRSDLNKRLPRHLPILERGLTEDWLDDEALEPVLVHEIDHLDHWMRSPLARALGPIDTGARGSPSAYARAASIVVTEARAVLVERHLSGASTSPTDVLPDFLERCVRDVARDEISGIVRAGLDKGLTIDEFQTERNQAIYRALESSLSDLAAGAISAISYALDTDPSALVRAGEAGTVDEFIELCYG